MWGHCLYCGAPVNDQSHCDACSDGPDGVHTCQECDEEFKSPHPLPGCHYHEDNIAVLRAIIDDLDRRITALSAENRRLKVDEQKFKAELCEGLEQLKKQAVSIMASKGEKTSGV